MDACSYDTASHFPSQSGAQNCLFCLKFRCLFGRKGTVLTIRGSNIISKTISPICIHLSKIWKYSRSNGCLSLWYIIIFPRLIWCSKLDILLEIWALIWLKRHSVLTIRGPKILSMTLAPIYIHLSKIRNYSRSKECLSLWCILTFPRLNWCSKLDTWIEIWVFIW